MARTIGALRQRGKRREKTHDFPPGEGTRLVIEDRMVEMLRRMPPERKLAEIFDLAADDSGGEVARQCEGAAGVLRTMSDELDQRISTRPPSCSESPHCSFGFVPTRLVEAKSPESEATKKSVVAEYAVASAR